jgi:hypothetical protein
LSFCFLFALEALRWCRRVRALSRLKANIGTLTRRQPPACGCDWGCAKGEPSSLRWKIMPMAALGSRVAERRARRTLARLLLVAVCVAAMAPMQALAEEQHQQAHADPHGGHYEHYDHAVTAAPSQVREQLDDFLESVGHVSSDAKATHDKKDVVDLSQSLRLVEDKFTGLRRALLSELGVAAEKDPAGAAALHGHTQDLVTAGNELIQRMGRARHDVQALVQESREVDEIMAQVRASLTKMENELSLLHNGLHQVQLDSSVVRDVHLSLRNSIDHVQAQTDHVVEVHGNHYAFIPKWYYVVLAEMFALGGFVLYKRYRLKSRHGNKYSKLG